MSKNYRDYYRTQQQHDTFVLFKNKEGWGSRYNSMEEITNLLQELKAERLMGDYYWSRNIKGWTYPDCCTSYEEAKAGMYDWEKVKFQMFLNGVEM